MNLIQKYFERSSFGSLIQSLSMEIRAKFRIYILFALLLFPILLYFIFVFHFSKNMPFMDDYMLFNFIGDYEGQSSFFKKIQIIFLEHNDHRVIFLKLITLAQYALTGSINFQHLILIGNAQIVGLLYIIWRSLGGMKDKLCYFLPVAYLLFGFSYFEASIWAMVSLSGLSVVIFSMSAIYFAGKDGFGHFVSASIFATLSVFTQGNGKIVLACCLAMYLYKKQYKKSIIWIFISTALIVMPLIFFGTTHAGYASPFDILQSPVKYIRHYLSVFSFLGAYFEGLTFYGAYFRGPKYLTTYFGSIILTLISGGLIFIYYLYLIRVRYYKKNIILFGMFTLIVFTAFGVGYARPSVVFPSRYAIYSTIAIILIYTTMLDLRKSFLSRFIVALCAGLIFIASFYQLHMAPLKIKYYIISVLDYEKNLVLSEYLEDKMNRADANRVLKNDLRNIRNDVLVRRFSELSVDSFLDGSHEKTEQIMTQKSDWFNEYIPIFSRELGVAKKFNIYNIKNM